MQKILLLLNWVIYGFYDWVIFGFYLGSIWVLVCSVWFLTQILPIAQHGPDSMLTRPA